MVPLKLLPKGLQIYRNTGLAGQALDVSLKKFSALSAAEAPP